MITVLNFHELYPELFLSFKGGLKKITLFHLNHTQSDRIRPRIFNFVTVISDSFASQNFNSGGCHVPRLRKVTKSCQCNE